MFNKFTKRAKRILVFARDKARRLNHDYLGPEHILLGLIEEGKDVVIEMFRNFGIDLESLKLEIEKEVHPVETLLLWEMFLLRPIQKRC